MPNRNSHSRVGSSLVEALVALALLELIATFTLTAALHAVRIRRNVFAAGATDVARLDAIRQAAASPSCRGAATATIIPITLPATPFRPSLTVELLCGR